MFGVHSASALRAAEFDVMRASEAGQSRADDAQILRKAIDEKRVLITLDGHFGDWVVLPLLRSHLPSRRIARILFVVHEGRIGVVNGFIKKTQKTPSDEIELARKRMKEMTS